MASIIYCDYLTGDDATGSGTAVLPYKTITQASTDLTGGDEVRVAKSTATTTLSGTLAWVDGSTSITTSVDLTSYISQGDFVGKDTAGETWWEATTITADTLTLYKRYSGTTETVSSKKLGITSTGAAATSTTQIQVISSSGSDVGNELKISGGWDLSTETQDGQTYFRQMHGTFTNRWGIGLYISGKNYVEIERLHFLRYYEGIRLHSSTDYCILTTPICNSSGSNGIILYYADYNIITSPICNSNGSNGINSYISNNNNFTTVNSNSNSSYGLYLYDSDNNTITTMNCKYNYSYGIYIYSSMYNNIISPTCNNNTKDGIYFVSNSGNNTITTPTCNNNSDNGIYIIGATNTITIPTCNNNNDNGIYITGNNNTVTTPTCNDNNQYGIRTSGVIHTITTPTCNNNNYSGLYMTNTYTDNKASNVTCNNNGYYGVSASSSFAIINTYSGTGNTNGDLSAATTSYHLDIPKVKCQHVNAIGDNRCYYEYGVTYRDTADARSGECLKFDPSSATYYIRQDFNFRAESGVAQTLSAYIKDDAAFDGDIQVAIYFMGVKITGWTEWTPTTSYVKKEIIAAAGDITEDGVLEFRIKVRGENGNVFVDDLGTA